MKMKLAAYPRQAPEAAAAAAPEGEVTRGLPERAFPAQPPPDGMFGETHVSLHTVVL